MTSWLLTLGVALISAAKVESAADAVTLRDGKVVLGQVVEPSPRGTLTVIVRRAWAEAHLPDLAKRWTAEEKALVRRAEALRRSRLEQWKRELAANTTPNDPITPWIERQLARLNDPAHVSSSRLMVANLSRGQVQQVTKAPKAAARLLRLAWRAGFKNTEDLSLDALEDGLEGRGFDVKGLAPVAVDHLLSAQAETEPQWLARRAATEAAFEPGLRFIRIQQLVLPEPDAGQPLDAKAALSALPDLAKLLGGEAVDPLPQRLKEVAAKGRVAAVVTRQEMSPDLDNVTVEMTLWVRGPGDRWGPFGSRSVTVRPAEVKDDEGKDLAEDPQVQMAFRVIESLGLGQVPDDVRKKSLNVGAATRKALAQARSAFQEDLAKLALPVGEADSADAKPEKGQ